MARKSWIRCRCGRKLLVKSGNTVCIPCAKKERKNTIAKKN